MKSQRKNSSGAKIESVIVSYGFVFSRLQPPTAPTQEFVFWSLLLLQSVASLWWIRVRLENGSMMHECLQKSTHVAPKIDPTSWKNRPQIDAKSIV